MKSSRRRWAATSHKAKLAQMRPSETKNPVARPLWPEYISPAPGRRRESIRAFLGFTARGVFSSDVPCTAAGGGDAGSGALESAAKNAIVAEGRSARVRSRWDWANVGGAAVDTAAQRSTREMAVLVETSRDDEPEG